MVSLPLAHRLAEIPAFHASSEARNQLAFTNDPDGITFSAFGQRVDRLSNAFRQAGLGPGDRVAIRLPNSSRHFECLFACARLSLILVPVAPTAAASDTEYVLQESAAAIVFDSEVRYESFIAGAQDGTLEDEPLEAVGGNTDPLLLMYTSGTTDRPKGVLLTQSNVLHTLANQIIGWNVNEDDRVLVAAPFHHVAGLLVLGLAAFCMRGSVHIVQPDPAAIFGAIERYRISKLFLSPQMWGRLARDEKLAYANCDSVKICASGGDPIPLHLLKVLSERFKAGFTNAYGLTEASSCSTLLARSAAIERHGSAGKALHYNKIRVVDADGNDVMPDEVGEIIQSGPTVMWGYWNRPEETEEVIRNGWLRTGDLGKFDKSGYLSVLGRQSERIVNGGADVFPATVERALREFEELQDVAVVAIPGQEGGEDIAAYVVPCAGVPLTALKLKEFAAARLADFERPRDVFICHALPRNGSGKVAKAELRHLYVEWKRRGSDRPEEAAWLP